MAYIGLKNEILQELKENEIDYELDSPNKFFSTHANLVPLQNSVQGPRVFYGAKFNNQALPVLDSEAPWVQTLIDGDPEGKSFDDYLGDIAGAKKSQTAGTITKIGKDDIEITDAEGNKHSVELYNNFPFNRKTAIHNVPVVSRGDVVKAGQILAKSNYTNDKGTLAMGLNAHVGLVPYKGYSFDDSVVISETFAKRLSSDHMDVFNAAYKRGVKGGKAHHVSIFSAQKGKNYYTNDQLDKLDDTGVAKPGTVLNPGDPIILATKPKAISSSSAMLGKLSGYMKNSRNDASEVWDAAVPGIVTDVAKTKYGAKVMVKSIKPVAVGDKLTFRSGQKNVVSKIVDDDHMLRTAKGRPFDVLLNPLSIPSRINNSMVYEVLLGKIAEATKKPYKLPAFNSADSKWFDYIADELKKNGLTDTETVFDPELNMKLENPITAGNAYILKLHHTATSKASARAQGAYDVNEQPLKGGSEEAQSKRISNLQDHALLSAGAYDTLKDMTILRGARNDEYWQRLREGYDPKTPDTPFVWNKFLSLLTGAGYQARKIGNTGKLRLGPMTDKTLNEMDPHDLENGELVELSTLEPIKGGLFDNSLVSSNKYGRIKLPFPIPNPAFEEPIRRILGLTEKQFRAIMEGEEELPEHLQKRLQGLK